MEGTVPGLPGLKEPAGGGVLTIESYYVPVGQNEAIAVEPM